MRVNGEVLALDDVPELEKNKKHSVELVVDRLVVKPGLRTRLADSVELALSKGDESLIVAVVGGPDGVEPGERLVSTLSTCPECKISLPRLSPQLFSFNSPQGACPACSGIGSVEYFEPDLLAPNKGLSLNKGAIIPWKNPRLFAKQAGELKKLGERYGFGLDTSLAEFSPEAWRAVFSRRRGNGLGRWSFPSWTWASRWGRSGATSWPASGSRGPARAARARVCAPKCWPCACAAGTEPEAIPD